MSDEAMKKVSKSPELRRPRARSLARDEGGAIAVLFALMLGALIGVMALAVDLGKAWNLQTELQHAADACALAGATQLDGTDGARARAIDACINKVAPPLVENTQRFASDGLGVDVTFDTNTAIDTDSGKALNTDIKFYKELPISAAVEAITDAEANYIEANVAPRRVDFSFAAVVGAVNSASPTARAVAGWTSFFCDSPPMMMCNPNEDPDGDASAEFNMYTSCPDDGDGDKSCVGRGITMKARAGAPEPGDFGYLALSVYNPDTGETEIISGAAELKDALADVNFNQVCTGNRVTTQPGNIASLDQYINQRFDLYPTLADAMNSNRQPAPNVGKGLVRKNPSADLSLGNCKYNPASEADSGDWKHPKDAAGNREFYIGPGKHQRDLTVAGDPDTTLVIDSNGDPIYTNDLQGDSGIMTTKIRAMAYPKDACNYLPVDTDVTVYGPVRGGGTAGCLFKVPPGNPGVDEGRQMGTGQWDIQTYLDVYQPGMTEDDLLDSTDPATYADLPNSPTIGPDGRISRWELYLWEKTYDAASGTYPNMAFEEEPICYRAPEVFPDTYNLPEAEGIGEIDRRIMIMAVVNCAAMGGGRRTVDRTKPHGNVAVFMTEPMGYTVADTLFGEMVDPLGIGIGDIDTSPNLVRERILLIE